MTFNDLPPGTAPARHQAERRVARCVRVLDLIRSEPCHWHRRDLAALFGVSERMIDNDLELLRGAGFPIRRRHTGYEAVD